MKPVSPLKKKLPPVILPRRMPKRNRFTVAKYMDEQNLKVDPEGELKREEIRRKASLIEFKVIAIKPEDFPGSLPDESVII